jgi:hypothetical protein
LNCWLGVGATNSGDFWVLTNGVVHASSKIEKHNIPICCMTTDFFIYKEDQMISDLLDEYPMLLLVAEAGVALFILVFIIVWTMMGRKKE